MCEAVLPIPVLPIQVLPASALRRVPRAPAGEGLGGVWGVCVHLCIYTGRAQNQLPVLLLPG